MLRARLLCLMLLCAAFGSVHALQPAPLRKFAYQEPYMGTLCRVVLYAPDAPSADRAAKAAFARIAELNAILSDYLADSELMRLCKKAGGDPVPVGPDLFEVLEKAERFSQQTGGALDVTIGPVVRLWRRARRTGEVPDPESLRQALALVDHKKIRLDPRARTVQLLLAGMLLDLGAIAKGYAADAALAVLRRHGVTRALVALGGDIAVGDAPPEEAGWKIGIAPLKGRDAPPERSLIVTNVGVSTAGDSEQAVEIAGQRYSHIMDPKTGLGLVGRRSVTVVAKDATTSDALDTAIAVMGRERGLDFARREGLAALLVFETQHGIDTRTTSAFDKLPQEKTP